MKSHYKLLVLCLCAAMTGCAVSTPPVDKQQRSEQAQQDREQMFAEQAPIEGALSLDGALSRAIRYNLENRVKMMEQALAAGQFELVHYDMLPRLTATAGYTTRDSELVMDSIDVSTRQIALGNTTSQETERNTVDLALTWNVLDFGVSYFQAQQQSDRAHIMAERQRKTIQTLAQQVRQAYWLAVGAQTLEAQVEPLLQQVNQALADARQIEKEKLRPPLETLNYRKTMLEVVRQLEAIRDELSQAKPRLAGLMNLAPGTPFSLEVPEKLPLPELSLSLEEMEQRALTQRPELYEADLQERISLAETKKAFARMLPGVEISTGSHYDSNAYLHNRHWADAGLRISWNLFSILSGPQQRKVAQSQVELAKAQRLALNMAVLSQIHVAYRDFSGKKRQYQLSKQLFELDEQILQHTRNAAESNAQSRMNTLRSGVSTLMADYRRYQNYASLQAAYGQVIASLGDDPLYRQ